MKKIFLDDLQIINLYNSGKSTLHISKMFKCAPGTIGRILKENNIDLRKQNKKYDFNEDYFEIIDTPDKAYFLGLLYADGWVATENNTIGIELQKRDGYILTIFKNYLNCNKPTKTIKSKNINHSEKEVLLLYSLKTKKDLIKLGCICNKSLILKPPTEEQVPENLLSHFIRGYFDGDGSISLNKFNGGRITFVGTLEVINFLKGIFNNKLGLNTSSLYNITKNKNTFVISINKRNDIIKFKQYLYKDCKNLYLTRKKEKFEYLNPIIFKEKQKCLIKDCELKEEFKSFCKKHYDMFRRNKNFKQKVINKYNLINE